MMVFEPRTADVSVAIEIASNESDDICRRPSGLLEAPTPAPASSAPVIVIFVNDPSAEDSLYKAKQLLHVWLQKL
ncbi:hypothetical protein C0J52_11018 [Blattella germanica]|nr:hypothetical protein C0J52_11018 [Blattella germanica]